MPPFSLRCDGRHDAAAFHAAIYATCRYDTATQLMPRHAATPLRLRSIFWMPADIDDAAIIARAPLLLPIRQPYAATLIRCYAP